MSQQLDTFYTYRNLNAVLRVFALSCLYHDGLKLKCSWSLYKNVIIVVLFGVINILSLFFKLQNSDFFSHTLDFLDFMQMLFLLGYVQYIIELYYVYQYGREPFLEYFRVYSHIDRVLYMPYYNVIKRNIHFVMFFFAIFGSVTIVFDYIVWGMGISWIVETDYSVDYIYFCIRLLVIVDIIANIIQVEYRLKSIGDVLEEFYLSSVSLPDVVVEVITKGTKLKNQKDPNRLNLLKTIAINREYSIPKLSRCYLLLLEQTDFINAMCGVRMLSTCVSLLIDTTMLLNLGIRIMIGSLVLPLKISEWFPVVSSFLRFLARGSIIFGGVYVAEQNYKELRRIVRLVDLLLINKKTSFEMRDTLKELRDMVLSRPVQFHAVQFFSLDYRLLVSITSVIITYTIILLQYMK